MPTNKLEICRAVLENIYQQRLGIEFASTLNEIGSGRRPFWRIVSADDFTTEAQATTQGASGLLLDPEIGLLSYIIPFQANTELRVQIKRALRLRSHLSTERNYSEKPSDTSDLRGSWRVALHWLVDASDKDKWTGQIRAVRQETAFSEEIAFDALFLTNTDIKTQIESYGFPRLLLTTREVFKKQQLHEVAQWLSANKLVEEVIRGFAKQFHKPEQRELADFVVRAMEEFHGKLQTANGGTQPPEKAKTLNNIKIRDFRNLRNVHFEFGTLPVAASIVHGPNGTGKSSLCEALSIALFQSSFRFKWFADRETEKDISATDRAREYVKQYLSPLESQSIEPQIALNSDALRTLQLVPAEQTKTVDLEMCGTVLTQDASLEFARMSADELGARVLRGYSELANHIEEVTESLANQANTGRQEFLRRLGLSASITKIETAYERIVKREVDQTLPPFPVILVAWLDTVGKFFVGAEDALATRWQAWGNDESRNALANHVASSSDNKEKLTSEIRQWLQRFNELVLTSTELIKNIKARIVPLHNELDNSTKRITAWGEWLEKKKSMPGVAISPEADMWAKKLNDLQHQQAKVTERGRNAGGHFDHLTQVEVFVRDTWSKHNADDCPTCGVNHVEHGGILKVVESLRINTGSERDRLREEYNKLKMQIEDAQKHLAALGQSQCPLNTEEQSNLTEALQWLLPQNANFAEWIEVKTQRDLLITYLVALRQIPTPPAVINPETEAERFQQRVLSQFHEANKTFDAPTNWKPVKDKLTKALAEIVNEHLPNTLAKLWVELTLNLTSAPWLLPDRPNFDVTTRRGESKVTVRVKERLARYILNQAEVHTLGLAWFFTRYLTQGRFFHACLIMDDPAHELDQTSFRDLCRLLETVMRLHRVYNRPLKLVVMMNQESRALETARATGGIFTMLGWVRDQESEIKAVNVIGEGFHPLQPARLFEALVS